MFKAMRGFHRSGHPISLAALGLTVIVRVRIVRSYILFYPRWFVYLDCDYCIRFHHNW